MADTARDLIDFADLAQALLERAATLVPQWLPGGKVVGHEYVCSDLQGGEGSSCSVNLTTGRWADFGSDDKGGDLTSLYAAIHGLNNGQAARQIQRDLGWQKAAPAHAQATPDAVGDVPGPAAPTTTAPARRETLWKPQAPVPAGTPRPLNFRHFHRGEPAAVWEYAFEGELYGYVCRYTTSDGGKDILPMTWCEDTGDGRGTRKWTFKQWDEPRPLYVPATLLSGDLSLPVVVVEGEKCAMAGHKLLGHEFDFVSWPGGGKAWAKAGWGWLMGRTVYLWPDCDAKRERLNRAERDSGVDPATKALLPEARQPGMAAMVGIGALLQAEQGCTVFICPVPAPGAVGDGWDIADAVEQGWDAPQVRSFIRGSREFVAPVLPAAPPAGAARAEGGGGGGGSGRSFAGAGQGADADDETWRDFLIKNKDGHVRAVRDNVVLALDGLPAQDVAGIAEAAGVIAFNDFTNSVEKLRATPWGTAAGEWDEVDELEMGHWLTRVHWMPSMSRATLEEAVAMVAKRHRHHPVRDVLAALDGTWDGQRRLHLWLRRCCRAEDMEDPPSLQQYLSRVGTWLVMAICARVLTRGCKFDYMTIFEGPQGWGKSTLARLLGIHWFADTGLVLGDKDSYQNLQGVLVYEWGELDSLTRSEVTKVKQFISSMKDRFRASFDRRPRDYPRQVIFIGTTNEDHYLTDPTGNRRMWPVRITRPIDLAWFEQHRDQLFAEALSYLAAGERFHPTQREQQELFGPQQQQRQIESAIQAAVLRYLYDEHQKVGVTAENGAFVKEISAPELLTRLGISVDKQTHVLLRQVTAALRQAGWERFRSSRADRPWMFRRPDGKAGTEAGASGSSTGPAQPQGNPGADSDCPF